MSQLRITDLDFHEEGILENEEIRGSFSFSNPSSGFFRVAFDFSQSSIIGDLSGEAGAGFGAAIALALGKNITIEIDTGVSSDSGLFSF
ncbi:hypothetical protein [Crocosphaera chwakensis]|uniref:Uncharacterized protein n=1 Tax=Crocosphaera chwakensis CCY0110 TaxID=391612 RepID=A3IQJ0_9CHRO|nr:hypothetical protein [Crocosphaera chwakensis]EAZ91265.1 hypothetical protein CY0110_11597 [Crocosphaera chwakensis CCY0110]